MKKSKVSFDEGIATLHQKLEDFRRVYNGQSVRFPVRFPQRPLFQGNINLLFIRFLASGTVMESPVTKEPPDDIP